MAATDQNCNMVLPEGGTKQTIAPVILAMRVKMVFQLMSVAFTHTRETSWLIFQVLSLHWMC
jgi:hypothetical protein